MVFFADFFDNILMKFLLKIIFVLMLTFQPVYADFKYILNDDCIKNLYNQAKLYFKDSEIIAIREPMGIILRFGINNAEEEYNSLSAKTKDNINLIQPFLEKNTNSVIIEVHLDKTNSDKFKSWEKSIAVANLIEEYFRKNCGKISSNGIYSIGYGEFLPSKNTSNNGGKNLNRVDIMILCK